MPRIAVIGGIGSGKSSVTDHLNARGALIVDADEIARDVVRAGRSTWQALRDAFGDAVLGPDGELDRQFVAQVVFHDPAALRRLNHITHAAIGAEMAEQAFAAPEERVVAVAIPLFRPMHRDLLRLHEVWCVSIPPEEAVRRLVSYRGFSESDAQARIANQISNDERHALSDEVLDNSGTLDQLIGAVDQLLARRGWLGA